MNGCFLSVNYNQRELSLYLLIASVVFYFLAEYLCDRMSSSEGAHLNTPTCLIALEAQCSMDDTGNNLSAPHGMPLTITGALICIALMLIPPGMCSVQN